MIRVKKTKCVPLSLRRARTPRSARRIRKSVYAASDVKSQLMADQHGKCAYCECRLNGDYGHVEHFRPKSGYTVPPDAALHRPGYYWLAYDWDNLLLSCSQCNTSYKGTHFALEDESGRDIRRRDISRESPLLIHPGMEDPAAHIAYHQHIAVPKVCDGEESRKGRYTIDLLGLNTRAGLVRHREELMAKHRDWERVAQVAETLIARGVEREKGEALRQLAMAELAKMRGEDAEHSAMFRK